MEKLQRLQIPAPNLEFALAEIGRSLYHGPSIGTHVPEPRTEMMSDDEWLALVRIAIEVFDTLPAEFDIPPANSLRSEVMHALRTHAEPIVHGPSYGVYKALQYWKHPGRETVWDERLKPGGRYACKTVGKR